MATIRQLRKGRTVAALASVAVATLVLGACGGSSEESSETAAPATTTDSETSEEVVVDVEAVPGAGSLACTDGRILVGIAKADSGVASFFDVAGKRGLEVAIDQINADGGIKGCPLEIISGDSKSDPAIGAEVARNLLGQGAQILVVADDFDGGIAAATVGQEAGVLTLSLAASSTQFGNAVGPLLFTGGITTTELGLAQARYALDQGWNSTFQAIDPGLAYFTEQDTSYRSLYEANGGEIVESATVDSLGGQADFNAVISKIKQANPDVIQALAVFPGVGTFVKQLREAGVDTPVIGNVTLQTRELTKLMSAEQANNIFYAAQVFFEGAGQDPNTDPDMVAFTEAYEAKFGQFPEQANAPGAYQTFLAIAQALQQEQVIDAQTAADAIRAQTNVSVPGGTLARWQDGYAIWDPVIAGVRDGSFYYIETLPASDLRAAVGQ